MVIDVEHHSSILSPYRSRRLAVGEGDTMRINRDWLDCVAFVCIDRDVEGMSKRVPVGTTFFVRVPDEKDKDISSLYLVTARHVIEDAEEATIYLRVNNVEGGFTDHATRREDWITSDIADVAAILFQPPVRFKDRNVEPLYRTINLDIFIRGDNNFYAIRTPKGSFLVPVEVGHDVFFIGLFTQTYGKERNTPIARFGNISRLPDEIITLPRWHDTGSFDTVANLVECHSWGGHSGSPAFWACPMSVEHRLGDKRQIWRMDYVQGFLGLVSAHFDITKKAETVGDILGEIRVGLNAGIAVVTPAEAIRELLMREDLVEDRRERSKRLSKQKPMATLDIDSDMRG